MSKRTAFEAEEAPKQKIEVQKAQKRKRDKKEDFKKLKSKFKPFTARVDPSDKQSVADYLNTEFQFYATRLSDTFEKQVKAAKAAKDLKRRQVRQEKSEQRKRGEAEGFGKEPIDYSDIPKVTVCKKELALSQAANGEPLLFDNENILTHTADPTL